MPIDHSWPKQCSLIWISLEWVHTKLYIPFDLILLKQHSLRFHLPNLRRNTQNLWKKILLKILSSDQRKILSTISHFLW